MDGKEFFYTALAVLVVLVAWDYIHPILVKYGLK